MLFSHVLLAGMTLGLLLAGGKMLLRVHHNPLLWMPKGGQARNAIGALDNHAGGSSDVSRLLCANPFRELKDADATAGVAEIHLSVMMIFVLGL